MMELFLVVVILNPTKKQREEESETPKVVVPVTGVMARDKSHAAVRAMALVPDDLKNYDDRLEVRSMTFPKG